MLEFDKIFIWKSRLQPCCNDLTIDGDIDESFKGGYKRGEGFINGRSDLIMIEFQPISKIWPLNGHRASELRNGFALTLAQKFRPPTRNKNQKQSLFYIKPKKSYYFPKIKVSFLEIDCRVPYYCVIYRL